MKVTLDLDVLLDEGKITQKEHDKFSGFSAKNTSSLGFSILIAFGVLAIFGGLLSLVPSAEVAIGIGLLILVSGIGVVRSESDQWQQIALIFVVLGALLFGGGVLIFSANTVAPTLFIVVVYAMASVFARSSFLAVLSVFLSSSVIGAMTSYGFATYSLSIQNPILTVLLYTALGISLYQVSKNVDIKYESIALAGAKASVFLVNFGFWIGSLWGSKSDFGGVIFPEVFSILWAIAIFAAGVWAVKNNRRWTLNVIATFGGIHFYTQWFDYLGASPTTLILLGVLTLGCVFAIKALNTTIQKETKSGK
jgi:hypothetical protein